MMEDERDVLAEEYGKSPAFSGYHIFISAGHIERCNTWKVQFLDFMKLKRMIQSWLLQICLETLSIPIHLKMEMDEFVA